MINLTTTVIIYYQLNIMILLKQKIILANFTMMIKKITIILFLFAFHLNCWGQIEIVQDGAFSDVIQKLRDGLDSNFDTDCLDVSYESSFNITLDAIDIFQRGNSNFPFERGFVLSTGQTSALIGPNLSLTSSTPSGTLGGSFPIQEILDQRIGNLGSYDNSKVIQVSFTPNIDRFELEYIFASESYQNGTVECFNGNSDLQDGFAIIIRGPGVVPDTYDDDNNPLTPEIAYSHGGKNIALLEDGLTEVGLHNVHANNNCSNLGDSQLYQEIPIGQGAISSNGHTVPMIAESDVIPGEEYTLEIFLTNRGSSTLDSALFLKFPPQSEEPQLESEYTLCVDETGVSVEPLVIDTNLTGSSSLFRWFREGQLLNNEINPVLLLESPGNYSLDVTFTTGCVKSYSFTVVPSSKPYNLTFEIIDNDSPNQKDLVVTNEGSGNYMFQLNNNGLQDSNIFSNLNPGIYLITVNDMNGCGFETIEVEVSSIEPLVYPKFFTPNSDGLNDIWKIDFGQIGTDGNVEIYNRFGQLLRSFNSSNNLGWDGTFNGRPVASSDYWFVLRLEDGRVIKSHFSLKR